MNELIPSEPVEVETPRGNCSVEFELQEDGNVILTISGAINTKATILADKIQPQIDKHGSLEAFVKDYIPRKADTLAAKELADNPPATVVTPTSQPETEEAETTDTVTNEENSSVPENSDVVATTEDSPAPVKRRRRGPNKSTLVAAVSTPVVHESPDNVYLSLEQEVLGILNSVRNGGEVPNTETIMALSGLLEYEVTDYEARANKLDSLRSGLNRLHTYRVPSSRKTIEASELE
jgi:hypothetical protein